MAFGVILAPFWSYFLALLQKVVIRDLKKATRKLHQNLMKKGHARTPARGGGGPLKQLEAGGWKLEA